MTRHELAVYLSAKMCGAYTEKVFYEYLEDYLNCTIWGDYLDAHSLEWGNKTKFYKEVWEFYSRVINEIFSKEHASD